MRNPISIKISDYSWGRLIVIYKGSLFSVILHPEHQAEIRKKNIGYFTDETRTRWFFEKSDDQQSITFKARGSCSVTVRMDDLFKKESAA